MSDSRKITDAPSSVEVDRASCPDKQALPESRFARRWKLLTLVLALLLSVALCEVILRFSWGNYYAGASIDHLVHIHIQPKNLDYPVDRRAVDPDYPVVRLRTDDRSYILPSSEYDDPDATVVFFGGSTSECAAVKESLRFHALMAAEAARHGLRVNALNVARSGTTIHDSLNILVNHVVRDEPDIVVAMHATNDVGVLARDHDYQSRSAHTLSLNEVGKAVKQVLSRNLYLVGFARSRFADTNVRYRDEEYLANRNDPDFADSLPSDLYRSRLVAFVRTAKAFGIRPVLMTQPLSGARNSLTPDWAHLGAQDRFNGIVREVCREEDVLLIDLAQHVASSIPNWDRMGEIFYDGMHVTDRGSQIYAAHIAERLMRAIEQIASGRTASREETPGSSGSTHMPG